MEYNIHLNGEITNRKSESDLHNILFSCFKDDEIRYANGWLEKEKKRPICSCGAKMKLVEYKGYYEEFRYWDCENCDLGREIQNRKIKPDKSWEGAYR